MIFKGELNEKGERVKYLPEELGAENMRRTREELERRTKTVFGEEGANSRQVAGDAVKQPGHYTQGGIETIDFLRAKLTQEQFRGFCLANVIKYVSRAGLKNGLEDLKKAQVYLGWLIETYNV